MEIFGKVSGLSPNMSPEQISNLAESEAQRWNDWKRTGNIEDSLVLDHVVSIASSWVIVENFYIKRKGQKNVSALVEQLKLKPLISYDSTAGSLVRIFAADSNPRRINVLLRYLHSLSGEVEPEEPIWALLNYIERQSSSEVEGLEAVIQANHSGLSETISTIQSAFKVHQDEFSLVRSAISTEFGVINGHIRECKSNLDALIESKPVCESEFTAKHDLLRAELKELLGLKAASSGWGDMRDAYKKRVRNIFWSAFITALLIGIYIALLFFEGMTMWSSMTADVLALYRPAGNSIPTAGIVAALTFSLFLLMSPLAFAVWIFRILLRTRDHQQHLEVDAEERSMMINTYADLTRLGYVREEDRATLLSSIFRPKGSDLSGPEPAPNFGPLLDTAAALVAQTKTGPNSTSAGRG